MLHPRAVSHPKPGSPDTDVVSQRRYYWQNCETLAPPRLPRSSIVLIGPDRPVLVHVLFSWHRSLTGRVFNDDRFRI
jgi:hypothetical protein